MLVLTQGSQRRIDLLEIGIQCPDKLPKRDDDLRIVSAQKSCDFHIDEIGELQLPVRMLKACWLCFSLLPLLQVFRTHTNQRGYFIGALSQYGA